MAVKIERLKISTGGDPDIIDITSKVAGIVAASDLADGIATVFVAGSTAGVTTIEYESGVLNDLRKAIDRAAPKNVPYEHDLKWGDYNGYAHVRAALIGPSITIPFSNKRLLSGTWQQIVLLDFDNRPRTREVIVQLVG